MKLSNENKPSTQLHIKLTLKQHPHIDYYPVELNALLSIVLKCSECSYVIEDDLLSLLHVHQLHFLTSF